MIKCLQRIGDPVILNFWQSEINPILIENAYHSPEESEEDESEDNGANRVVIRDLSWRSDTVSIRYIFFCQSRNTNSFYSFYILKLRIFLRDYLDTIFYQQRPDKRKRIRAHDDNHFATGETDAPLNAPRWTKSGYNGSMKAIIKKATSKYKNCEMDELDIMNALRINSQENPKSHEFEESPADGNRNDS